MMMKKRLSVVIALIFMTVAVLSVSTALAAKKRPRPVYVGFKKCGGCHVSQKNSWLDTSHATAFELLKKNERAAAKKKAGLNPVRDYTKDKSCLRCHTTGFGKKGGYKIGMDEKQAKRLEGVGCESCHGRGSIFRKKMKTAKKKYKEAKETTARMVLVKAGKRYKTENTCNGCHMNYEGSPWERAKPPYSPHTPKVDAKYKFDFAKAVRDFGAKGKAMHEHFKVQGMFTGKPIPKLRAEFQKDAKEEEPADEEALEDEEE
ncbi:MAG: cytochrome c family protein [Candidatus Hydrothermarchaeaceae archaeon]